MIIMNYGDTKKYGKFEAKLKSRKAENSRL